MKTITKLQTLIRDEFRVKERGSGTYALYSPFTFDDGDAFVVLLRENEERWSISDQGHTFMHLSYTDVDISHGTRAAIIDDALRMHSVQNRDGELIMDVPVEMLGYGVASFLHAIEKICGVTKFTREKVRSTFRDDLERLLRQELPEDRIQRDWYDLASDPDGIYVADYRIEGQEPWLLFGITSNDKCRRATIVCLHAVVSGLSANKLAIFEDQTKIDRKALAQVSDAVDKQFSSIGNKSQIVKYIRQKMVA